MEYTILDETPVGALLLAGDSGMLSEIRFLEPRQAFEAPPGWEARRDPFRDAIRQLQAYFTRQLTEFRLPLAPQGTEFQRRVWSALGRVPFGRTASYGEIARQIGQPTASRAVGAANGRNPLPIVVPCHRVIGSDGSLTGFGGGLAIKRTLLQLEGICV